MSVTFSMEKVENVVNPPKSPVTAKSLTQADTAGCNARYAVTSPITKAPTRLQSSVPAGITSHTRLNH